MTFPDSASTHIVVLFTELSGVASLYKIHGSSAGHILEHHCSQTLAPLIRTYHGKVIKTVGGSIMAYFPTAKEALFAAIALQKKMAMLASAGEGVVLELRIAINEGFGIVEEHDVFGDAVNIAGKVLAQCTDGDILVTEPIFRAGRSCEHIAFLHVAPPPALFDIGVTALYRVAWHNDIEARSSAPPGSPLQILTPLLHRAPHRAGVRCFYCGATAHTAKTCPSRLLREPTAAAEKLSNLPLLRLIRIITDTSAAFERPLATGSDDHRHEMIMNEHTNDEQALCFFAFYERGYLFQLRALRSVMRSGGDVPAQEQSGALLMAEDCLRVARHHDARVWLHRAAQEQPEDWRLLVLEGLLHVQEEDLYGAQGRFAKALRNTADPAARRYITCLLARSHELCGEPDRAHQELECGGLLHENSSDIIFYDVFLCAQTGAMDTAAASLRQLLARHARYYVLLALSLPHLGDAETLLSVLDQEYRALLNRARSCRTALVEVARQNASLFDPDDDVYRKIGALCAKADAIMQEESIAGLMDIPALEGEASMLIRRAVDERSRLLKRSAGTLLQAYTRYADYLAQFPYPRLIRTRHRHLKEAVDRECSEVRSAAAMMPPPPAREVRSILHCIQQRIEELAAAEQRLERMRLYWWTLRTMCRAAAVCCITTAVSTLACAAVLALYRVYETSYASLTPAVLLDFLRFGLVVGAGAGIATAGFWFAKHAGSMYKNSSRTR
ncbi:MAG: hypothetical protein N3B18_07410 [Desulfobacterota bacterium]|nr:hypothetical protein [Thermodesulfobacteriota bacterium]